MVRLEFKVSRGNDIPDCGGLPWGRTRIGYGEGETLLIDGSDGGCQGRGVLASTPGDEREDRGHDGQSAERDGEEVALHLVHAARVAASEQP